MKASQYLVSCSLLLSVGCIGDDDVHSQSQADVLPYGEVTIADALVRSSDATCAPALRVHLLSYGTGLRVESYQHLDPGCEPADDYPSHEYYDVKSIEYYAGRKTYLATSQQSALWIHDDREAGTGTPTAWTVATYNYEALLAPGYNPWRSYTTNTVADYNQRASGDKSIWIRIRVKQPLDMAEVQKLVYSLVIDKSQSHVVETSSDMAFDLLVVSDFPVAHVLSQLRGNELVKSADLR